LKKLVRDYAGLFVIAGLIVILDQVTKELVRANLAYSEMWSPWDWLAPYARVVHWQNTGAAFGMLQGFSSIFAILAVLVSVAIIYYYPRVSTQEWPLRLAMAMQLAGASGNLIDRIRFDGKVTDFISIGNFAVWNVADASITLGVVILLIWVWWKERQEKQEAILSNAEPSLEVDNQASTEGRTSE
jgi:signal peptidase II